MHSPGFGPQHCRNTRKAILKTLLSYVNGLLKIMNKPRLWHILGENGKFDLLVFFATKYLHDSCNLNYLFLPYLQNTTENKWDLLVFPKFESNRRIASFMPDCAMHCDSIWKSLEGHRRRGGWVRWNLANTVWSSMKSSNNLKINKVVASNKSQKGGGDTWTIYLMKLVLLNDTCSQFQRAHNVSPSGSCFSHFSCVYGYGCGHQYFQMFPFS